jgi:hypothetical protein
MGLGQREGEQRCKVPLRSTAGDTSVWLSIPIFYLNLLVAYVPILVSIVPTVLTLSSMPLSQYPHFNLGTDECFPSCHMTPPAPTLPVFTTNLIVSTMSTQRPSTLE